MRDALSLAAAGRYGEALACWPAKAPPDGRILSHKARALYEEGRDEEAWAASDEAMSAKDPQLFVLWARAQLVLDEGRPAEALDLLDRIRERDARNVLLAAYRGLARFACGDRRGGLEDLRLHLRPVSPALQSRVARELESWLGPGEVSFARFVLEGDDDPELAVFAALNRYLLWPERAASWLHVELFDRKRRPLRDALARADAAARAGRHAVAAAELRQLLSAGSAPDLAMAAAEAHLLAGEPEQALELLANIPDGDDPYLAAYRGAALFRAGRAAEALPLLEPAAAAEHEDFTLPYLWGLALLSTGDRRRGRRAFEQALAMECPFLTRALVDAARERA